MKVIGKILVLLCGLAFAGMLWAADEDPDTELLEFLGGWEGEDNDWQEYFDSISPTQETAGSDMNDRSKQHDVE